MKRYPVIVALDGLALERSLSIARHLKGIVWGFKVHDLYVREGPRVISKLKRYGKVFLDLKFHDIPETVAHEVAAAVALGVDLVTIHAAGGRDMCEAAVRAGERTVAAVTVLTSLPKAEARRVPHLASLARAAGVHNIVASPLEVSVLKKLYPTATLITPGIRSTTDLKQDQARTLSAQQALDRGASLLVIGRPITQARNPRTKIESLFDVRL